MRDFNLVKADLIQHLKLSFQADNGAIYWYEGTMAALFAMMSFCFDIEHNHKIEVKPVSNADRIRSMTDEELAKYLAWLVDKQTCSTEWLIWLKDEVKNV